MHDLGLAFGRRERIQLNRAPVWRAWSRRTHGSPSLDGRIVRAPGPLRV
jgi:hypothetical protein